MEPMARAASPASQLEVQEYLGRVAVQDAVHLASMSPEFDACPVLVYMNKNPTFRALVETYKATHEAGVRQQRQPS
jgi:hypothetical protein